MESTTAATRSSTGLVTYLAAGLARTGGRLLYAGAQQKRLTLPAFRLAGTPDGLVEWRDRSETVLEVKSHGASANYDNGPSEMHVRQAELNIELFHEVTAHRPEDAIIIYGLAEDYERLALHRVERRPAVFVEMLGKAAAAFDALSAAAVTAEGVVTQQCVICPYRSRCAAAQQPSRPPEPAASPRRRCATSTAWSPPIGAPWRPKTKRRELAPRSRAKSSPCSPRRRQQGQAQRLRHSIENTQGRPRRS